MGISIEKGEWSWFSGTENRAIEFKGVKVYIDWAETSREDQIRQIIAEEPQFENRDPRDPRGSPFGHVHLYYQKQPLLEWLANLEKLSIEAIESLANFFKGEDFVLEGEQAFWFINMLYNHVPGRSGSAYGLGVMVGGSLGGYIAESKGLKVEYLAKANLIKIKAGEYAGRMIGRKGINVKAITAFFSLVRPTRVNISD